MEKLTIFGTPIVDGKVPKDEQLAAMVLARIQGVIGEQQERDDTLLVGNYAQDVLICEAAIDNAQLELDGAKDDYDAAWAWYRLDEAYLRFAHVMAREALARWRIGAAS